MRAFVIAMDCEAAVVRPALRLDDRLLISGVGKVNAAAATQRLIDAGATEIWNIGLAGGFDPAMEIGACYRIDRAVEYDFDLAKVNGTRIGVHNERTTPYFDLLTDFAFELPCATLATGDRFNDREDDLVTLADLRATVRDMEGAAVAHVCENHGVSCRMVKCLSDVHGKGSMTEQYLKNKLRALESLRTTLLKVFR